MLLGGGGNRVPLLLACITEGGFLQPPALDAVFSVSILREEPAHWGRFRLCLWLPGILHSCPPALGVQQVMSSFSSILACLCGSQCPVCLCLLT